MQVILIDDSVFYASFFTFGYKEWSGNRKEDKDKGDFGLIFYCTDAIIWKPMKDVKAIDINGHRFTKVF
jgi:hypothetical protein